MTFSGICGQLDFLREEIESSLANGNIVEAYKIMERLKKDHEEYFQTDLGLRDLDLQRKVKRAYEGRNRKWDSEKIYP